MKYFQSIFAVLTLVVCTGALANGRVFPKEVTAVKIGNTGYVEIKFENDHEDPGECNENLKGIFIRHDHPGKDAMLSLALYAKASKSKVTAWIDSCLPGYGNGVYNLEVQ